jgi:hypothetical protein
MVFSLRSTLIDSVFAPEDRPRERQAASGPPVRDYHLLVATRVLDPIGDRPPDPAELSRVGRVLAEFQASVLRVEHMGRVPGWLWFVAGALAALAMAGFRA